MWPGTTGLFSGFVTVYVYDYTRIQPPATVESLLPGWMMSSPPGKQRTNGRTGGGGNGRGGSSAARGKGQQTGRGRNQKRGSKQPRPGQPEEGHVMRDEVSLGLDTSYHAGLILTVLWSLLLCY